jgi:hypothetical protein
LYVSASRRVRTWQARKDLRAATTLEERPPDGWKACRAREAAAREAEKVNFLPRESDEVKTHLEKLEELAAVRSEAKSLGIHPLPPAQHTVTRYICKTVKSGNAGKAQRRERAQSLRAIAVKVNDTLHLEAVMQGGNRPRWHAEYQVCHPSRFVVRCTSERPQA